MKNAAIQAMIADFGARIYGIIFNNMKFYLGYPGHTVHVEDIEFKTFGGEDFIGLPRESMNPAEKEKGIKAMHWHRTDTIECVLVMDESCADKRMDPFMY